MRVFLQIIANTLAVSVTNFFVWFALTFWVYLNTQSVVATSVIGGSFMVMMAASGMWMGAIVDHHRKKRVMIASTIASLLLYIVAAAIYDNTPIEAWRTMGSAQLWMFVGLILLAVIAGNVRGIALPVLVTMLVPEGDREKANGVTGMVMGASSVIAGITSGIALTYLGMSGVIWLGIMLTALALVHLCAMHLPEEKIVHTAEKPKKIDIAGTIKMIRSVPGLLSLIFFTTSNNFLGGVFAALMDAYGLTLVSVQTWGVLWGVLSLGFMAGGLYIAKYGLSENPLRQLFWVNGAIWLSCLFFAIQPSIILLCAGILIWVILSPFIEAIEHTIVQRVVPMERQGRVIGFAQSVELSASPIASFMIGPVTQFVFIPFMTTGAGVQLIGDWFGVGPGRGIALAFIAAGALGLCITYAATRSKTYAFLQEYYTQRKEKGDR